MIERLKALFSGETATYFRKKEFLIGILLVLVGAAAFLFPQEIRTILGIAPPAGGLPSYEGNPIREYREVPEEVRLFTQEQRDMLRQKLGDHAGSLDANPDQLDPWLQAGVIKKIIGDFEGARDAWEYASLIRPKNFVSFKNLGELYWHYLPDYPRSEENFRKAIENEPKFIDSYISLSELYRYSYTEKQNLAEAPLLDGIRANPGSKDLTIYLARFYRDHAKNKEKAIEYYEKFVELAPDNKDAREELEMLQR